MTYQLFAISDEWQAEERRCRRADAERIRRNEEALALVGYVSPAARLRSRVVSLLTRLAKATATRLAHGVPPATAGQA